MGSRGVGMTSRHSNPRGFTLVELLVVIGIIGLMMALIMPAFRGFGRSASMNGAVAQVRSSLALARQLAITKRTLAYVIFADSRTAAAMPAEAWRANRSYAVFMGTNSTGDGYYVKEWTALPPGIVITPDTSGYPGIHGDNIMIYPDNMNKTNTFPNSASATKAPVRAMQFDSDGHSVGGEVYITEGTVETNGTLTLKPGASALKYGIEVKALTGQLRVRDYN